MKLHSPVKHICFSVFVITIQLDFPTCFCELFTSVCQLRSLPAKERELIQTFDRFFKTQPLTEDVKDIKRFVEEMRAENNKAAINYRYVENPINSFHLLHRTVSIWGSRLEQFLGHPSNDNKSLPFFMNTVLNNTRKMASWPKPQDLVGASLALVRLRYIYKLDVQDLVQGKLLTTKTSGLTGQNLLVIGQSTSEHNDLVEAVRWLNYAISELTKKKNNSELVVQAYRSLGNVLIKLNAPHFALETVKKALNIRPMDDGIRRDIAIYNDVLLDFVQNLKPLLSYDQVTIEKRGLPMHTVNYAELCRGELKTVQERSQLFCKLRKTRIPLIYAKVEFVHIDPDIMLYHDVISENEINEIKYLSWTEMSRSTVFSSEILTEFNDARISSNAWLHDNFEITNKLSKRIELLTNLSTLILPEATHGEPFQVVNYGLGGMYEPHFDFMSEDGNPKSENAMYINAGDRIATWMFYLSNVLAGGATVFPKLRTRIPVQKGSAAFWFNSHRNGLPDTRTLHAGCPVVEGDKWVANKWTRSIAQAFRRPCSLKPDV